MKSVMEVIKVCGEKENHLDVLEGFGCDVELFSNCIGFYGRRSYNSKYITRTRCFHFQWPHNNIFARCKDEEELLDDIFKHPVGMNRCFAYKNDCCDLKAVLKKFLFRHRKTNYKILLSKCVKNRNQNRKFDRPLPRSVLKEYIHKLVRDVIPLNLFGNEKERTIFERNVKKILFFGKNQIYSLNILMMSVGSKNKSYLKSIYSLIDKTNLLAKLYSWMLRCFIFAALKCVFYVTESNFSNKYLFYDKSTWQRIHERSFGRLKKCVLGTYKNYMGQTFTKENLYILRILPKRSGSRQLYMKWKKRNAEAKNVPSETQIVTALLKTFANERFFIAYGSSGAALHKTWAEFHSKWLKLGKPFVYYVRADFTDAFGSINQSILVDSIRSFINKKANITEIVVQHKYKRLKISVSHAFRLIKNYVSNFLFKHNKYVYRLQNGIPQGAFLSSVLCNYYFGAIDLEFLSNFAKDDSGFLVRNCDDYLFVTFNREKAEQFLLLLENGFPDYNLKLNVQKTETNMRDEKLSQVAFNGISFDVKSLQVRRCFKSFQSSSVFHSSAFRNIGNPGKLVRKRTKFLCCQKFENILFDGSYNLPFTILLNVYETASLNAVRLLSFIETFFVHFNHSYITRCVDICSTQIVRTVSFKVKNNESITKNVLIYIVLYAYRRKTITVRNSRRFREVANYLKNRLSNLKIDFSIEENELVRQFETNRNDFYKFIL